MAGHIFMPIVIQRREGKKKKGERLKDRDRKVINVMSECLRSQNHFDLCP